jgi:hypothetical protein
MKLQPIIFHLSNGGGATLTSNITNIYNTSLTSLPDVVEKGSILLHCNTRLSLPITTEATFEFFKIKINFYQSPRRQDGSGGNMA